MNVLSATTFVPSHHKSIGAYDSLGDSFESLRTIQRRYSHYVKQLVLQTKPHVIHAHDWLTMEAGIVAKQAAGIPLIVHVHATEFDRSGETYGNPLVHEIEQNGLLMADRIIAVSNITKKLIIKHYGIPAEKIDVVHNTLDAAALGEYVYDRSTYVYLQSLQREGYTVVTTIGRLTIQKGIKYFLHAAARASEKYDKLLFLIAGSGELRDELVALSADLGISDKVFFTGFVRGQAWRDAYVTSDMFVMSSVSEPFGLTALEAAAHDTAVLISRQSGVGEVLRNIMRFDYWDIDHLADEMVGIALSPSLQRELKRNVAREYDQTSWGDVARNINNTYLLAKGVAA
jgi:glycosyltransferase involved in cell wall biosynthesis